MTEDRKSRPDRETGQNPDAADEAAKPSAISLRCRRCRFVIVVPSLKQANGLGWVNISLEDGTGLCRACRAETDR